MNLDKEIRAYVITAEHEHYRRANVQILQEQLPDLKCIDAIYPTREKVPFIEHIRNTTFLRTGNKLNYGEIGILLSSRRVWQDIARSNATDEDFFLILESDSVINDIELLNANFHKLTKHYDLFFFGGWLGNIKLLKSKKKKLNDFYSYGEPYIKTICSGYGYAINKKTAQYLLKASNKVAYPADEFKKYIDPSKVKIGAVLPELISQSDGVTTIGHNDIGPIFEFVLRTILNIRNSIICYFK
jgi:GR25 family glycosyltransferase involved in LPS biosynthesis